MEPMQLQQLASCSSRNNDAIAAAAKHPSALNKILTAIVDGQDSPKEGLIRAFREQHSDPQSATSTLSSVNSGFYGSEPQSPLVVSSSILSTAIAPNTPQVPSAVPESEPAKHQTQQAESSSSSISVMPRAVVTAVPDVIPLNAYRMLTMAPSLPQSMQRSQWTSYDYHILEKLYTGYASKVYKAVCKRSNEVVVLKSYQLSAICELYQHQIFREVGLHSSLEHENVVQLSAAFQEGDFVVLVQEYAAGGNLFDMLQKYGGRLTEHVTVQMVLEPFLRVLQYLHTRGIIHRDIKPENILFSSNMTLKLADFGLAIDLRRERAVTRAGTLDYMAPEVLNCPYKNKPDENKEKSHLHYSGTVDSWAVGVLAYELLVGCPPFYDSSRDRVEARIRNSTPTFPRTMSDNARGFITAALTKDPSKRPSVLQLLNHPWINTFRARRSQRQMSGSAAGTSRSVPGAPAVAAAAAPIPVAAAAASPAAAPASPAAAHGVTKTSTITKPVNGLLQNEPSYNSIKSIKAAAANLGSTAAAAAAAAAAASSSPTNRLQQLQERRRRIEETRAVAAAESRAAAAAAAASKSGMQGYSKGSLAAAAAAKSRSPVSPRTPVAAAGARSAFATSPRTISPRTASPSHRAAAAVAAAAASVASLPPSPYKPAGTILKTPRVGYSATSKPSPRAGAVIKPLTAGSGSSSSSSSSRPMGSAKSSPMLLNSPKDLTLTGSYTVEAELPRQRKKWVGTLDREQ